MRPGSPLDVSVREHSGLFDLATSQTPEISVVVPVYGGADALPELSARVRAALSAVSLRYELILVDDRGDPRSWAAIRRLADDDANVRGIRLARNFGQHAATLCGIEHARGTWIVTLDDDLEQPPECIPTLIAAGEESGCPVVYGTFAERSHSAFRNATSEAMRRTLKRAFPEMNTQYTSLRAIRSAVAKQLLSFGITRPYIDGMLSWITSDVASVEVPHDSRRHGRSAYTLRRLVSHALNVFVTFSHLPLRVVTYAGSLLALASFAALLVIVYGKLSGRIEVSGYASLMSTLLFACGIQLAFLGIIGEYIGRLMGATYRRPMYVTSEHTPSLPRQSA